MTSEGSPKIQRYSFDQMLMIAEGLDPTRSLVHKFGGNAAIGTTLEDIWTPGGVYPWPTAAETVRIKAGGNAADDASENGARSIRVEGLDDNFLPISEDIVTNGASASTATTALFRRVFRAYVLDVGVYGAANTGDIDVENTSSTNVLAQIPAGSGQTEMTQYTIPAAKKGYLLGVTVHIGSAVDVSLNLMQRQNADDVTVPFSGKRLVVRILIRVTGATHRFRTPIPFEPKTDLWVEGTSASSSSASVSYDLVLVNQAS